MNHPLTSRTYQSAHIRMRIISKTKFSRESGTVPRATQTLMTTAVVKVSASPLPITTVVELLNNPPQDSVITLPPVQPKAGDVYIYSAGNDTAKKGKTMKHTVTVM